MVLADQNQRIMCIRLFIPLVALTLVVQVATVVLTVRLAALYLVIPPFAPAGTSTQGSVINVFLLVGVALAVGFLMVWLLRAGRIGLLRGVLIGSVTLGSFLVTRIVTFLALLGVAGAGILSWMIALLISGMALWSALHPNRRLIPLLLFSVLGVEVGVYLALTVKPPMIFMLPMAFVLYDLYAVFKGPLRTLLSSEAGRRILGFPFMASIGAVQVGLGDLVFYSLLPAAALLLTGLAGAVMVIFALNLGLVATLYLLTRFDMFPGLPIPILASTALLTILFLNPYRV